MSSMSFSDRVRSHPRISSFQEQPNAPLSLAVKDQLLVCNSAWIDVEEMLGDLHIDHAVLTTVLDGLGLPVAEADDVKIVELRFPGAEDVFGLTAALRVKLGVEEAHKVSPNHVLIPAPESHGCPWGPPSPVPHPPKHLQPATTPFVEVTIIDSGYQWFGDWGDNPLDDHGPIDESEADYVDASGKSWAAGIPDVPTVSVKGKDVLGALAGHANFIAGVIAQGCEHARLTVRNHNGGFDPDSDDFPTEAAVARSLCQSVGAQVIDLGFAFKAFGESISCVWDLAFKRIGGDPIVVAPAGNQNSAVARYPAALSSTYPNVLGVGSVDGILGDGKPKMSSFSNHGAWVTCAARGSHVHSTFLHVDLPVEDDPAKTPKSRDFTKSSWAKWNGTSFATPKIVAELALALADGSSPVDAVKLVTDRGVPDPAKKLGVVLDV
jgi:hypothetical protein